MIVQIQKKSAIFALTWSIFTGPVTIDSVHCISICVYIYTRTRSETIYRNIAILKYLLLQYNTIWPIENIDILHIAIYC